MRFIIGKIQKTERINLDYRLGLRSTNSVLDPEANRNQLTALAGLDPMVRESGTSLHRRMKISKRGSHLLRRVLYCAAMSGVQHNAEWKSLYDAFLARGKQRQVILVAVMRKILLLSHALYKENRPYEERGKYLEKKQT